MQRRRCLFSGNVQGVGFRYTVYNLALQYDVTGYVRNLSDGRVELVMEGAEGDLNQLAKAIQERMEGFVSQTTAETSPATGEFTSFNIRH